MYFLHLPPWVWFLFLYLATVVVIYPGRAYFEPERGAYNVSFTNILGDVGPIGIFLISLEVFRRFSSDDFGLTASYVWAMAVISLIVGLVAYLYLRPEEGYEVMDIYHNVFIIPLYTFLLFGIALPALWAKGTASDWIGVFLLFVLWVSCLTVDVRKERLNQKKFLETQKQKVISNYLEEQKRINRRGLFD